MAVQWYYRVMGQECGPVSPSDLLELTQRGEILPFTDVRKGAEGNWVTASRVKGLFPVEGDLHSPAAKQLNPELRSVVTPRPNQAEMTDSDTTGNANFTKRTNNKLNEWGKKHRLLVVVLIAIIALWTWNMLGREKRTKRVI